MDWDYSFQIQEFDLLSNQYLFGLGKWVHTKMYLGMLKLCECHKRNVCALEKVKIELKRYQSEGAIKRPSNIPC